MTHNQPPEGFSTWNVTLKGPAKISKIIVWNSDSSIPWLRITLHDGESGSISKVLNQSGQCRYEWTPSPLDNVMIFCLETSRSVVLHVDEVEVIGKRDRGETVGDPVHSSRLTKECFHFFCLITGMPIDLLSVGASEEQHPGVFTHENRSSLPEFAINGRFENNSGGGDGVASTVSFRAGALHWFQIDEEGIFHH